MVHLIRKNLILYFIRVVVKLLNYTIVLHIFTTHNEPQNLFITKFYPAAIYLIAVITIVFCHSGSAIDFQSPAVSKGQAFSSLAPCTWGGGGASYLQCLEYIYCFCSRTLQQDDCFVLTGGLNLSWPDVQPSWRRICPYIFVVDIQVVIYRCNIIGSGTVVVYQKTNFLSSYANIKGSNRGNL